MQVFRGNEDKFIKRLNFNSEFRVFTPIRTKLLHRKSGTIKTSTPMFPGYIFVSTNHEFPELFNFYKSFISSIEGCIRIVRYKDNIEALLPQERQFIEQFTNEFDIIDTSKGFVLGNKIIITEGPLVGKESIIKKINRHKRTAIVEITLFGETQLIELSCEILTKKDDID